MKKYAFFLTLTLTLLSCKRTDVIIDESTFPDYNFRHFVLSQWYGKDGVLTSSEVDEITEINVEEVGIEDLKGIEYFSSLGTLFCGKNELSSLDLSNNTQLWRLFCWSNHLKSLNISSNIELKVLRCDDNELKELDLSKNKMMRSIDCSYNQLSILDVSNNKELEIR